MGRHQRKSSVKPTHTAVLAITLLSALSPLAILAFSPSAAEATSPGTTLELPDLPLDQALAQAKLAVPTTSTTTPKRLGKVDKEGFPVEVETATTTSKAPVRRTTPTTTVRPTTTERQVVRSTTTTRPPVTTTRRTTSVQTPTTTRRAAPTTTTQRPTPKPTTTTRTTTNPPSTTTTRTTTPPVTSGRTSGLGLAPSAARATEDILRATGFTGTLLGRASRPGNPTSDHPRGYAVDFMTTNLAVGNEIKAYALANQARLGVKYVIWQSKDHYDHVHISFVG